VGFMSSVVHVGFHAFQRQVGFHLMIFRVVHVFNQANAAGAKPLHLNRPGRRCHPRANTWLTCTNP
jgi:hypothetical protein